jgi:hypothetical protein
VDPRWGGCAEELLHYTSRYYGHTEVFLRQLTRRYDFRMAGYQAAHLTEPQQSLMTAILAERPSPASGQDVIRLVERVRAGDRQRDEALAERYANQLADAIGRAPLLDCHGHEVVLPRSLPPLDPFMALAERLRIPVAVSGRRVEVPFEQLVRHLDSPLPQVRDNLQHAILWLHEAGYHLCNHPHLTHAQTRKAP